MLVLVQHQLQPRSIDGAPIVYMEIGKLGSMEFLLKLVVIVVVVAVVIKHLSRFFGCNYVT